LVLWLVDPPQYTAIFVVFMMVNGMVSNLGSGFDASIQATGNIKKNQIGYSLINLSLLPIIFILYKLGLPPYANVISMVALTFVTLLFQIKIMSQLTQFSVQDYINKTIKPSILATIVALLPLLFISVVVPKTIGYSITFTIFSLIWTIIAVLWFGLTQSEKEVIRILLKKIFKRK
jgi:hypothetical protein